MPSDTKAEYIKSGDKIYEVKSENTKASLLKEFDERILKLNNWRIDAIARVEKDYKLQVDEILKEKSEIEKL